MNSTEAPRDFRTEISERVMSELEETRAWYERGLERFGEMTVETADLTDGEKWKATLTPEGEIAQVDGAFFTLSGQKVTKYKPDGSIEFGWTQPGLLQKESEMDLPTRNGIMRVKTSGFVGILLDEDNHALVTLTQEPFATTPKRVLIRTPFQTSATKLEKLLAGEREFDPGLYDALVKLGGSEDISAIFENGVIDVFPLPFADANRIEASNTGFALRITDHNLRQELVLDGRNRWLSPRAMSYVTRAGLINGHTANAYLGAQSSLNP